MNRRYPKPNLADSNGKGAISAIKKENLSTAKTAVTNNTLHSTGFPKGTSHHE